MVDQKDGHLLTDPNSERMADILADVNEEYRSHLVTEYGKTAFYVTVIRAIYGCIESTLQWYKLFSDTLQKLGFTLNPYDKCVANKMINGKQITKSWFVDDCIVSHVDQNAQDESEKRRIKEFGVMEITSGNIHDFLRMKIGINENRTISVNMRQQLRQVKKELEKFDTIGAN